MRHETIEQGKKRRRKQRRADKQDLSTQVRKAIWEDREGLARPTPERLVKGDFEIRDAEDAGVSYAVDKAAHLLDRLRSAGKLSEEQATAGFDFAGLCALNRPTSEGRSCLDFSPVGHDGNIPDDARAARDYRELYLCLGTFRWAECRRVCVEEAEPRNWARLIEGLDLAAKFFRT